MGMQFLIPHFTDENDFYRTEFGFTFADICRLDEAGLVSQNHLVRTFTASSELRQCVFIYGSKLIILEANSVPASVKFLHYPFTTAGTELLPLVKITPKIALIKKFASTKKGEDIFSVKSADIVEIEGDIITYRDLTEVGGEASQ